jgi:hypothetical protein
MEIQEVNRQEVEMAHQVVAAEELEEELQVDQQDLQMVELADKMIFQVLIFIMQAVEVVEVINHLMVQEAKVAEDQEEIQVHLLKQTQVAAAVVVFIHQILQVAVVVQVL